MGVWADVMKVLRSPLFSNLLKTGGYEVEKSRKTTNVEAQPADTDKYRHVWFSDSSTETKRAYSDKMTYNPMTDTLKVGKVEGVADTAKGAPDVGSFSSSREPTDTTDIATSKQGMAFAFRNTNGFGLDDANSLGYFKLYNYDTGETREDGSKIYACGLVPSTNGKQSLGVPYRRFKQVCADNLVGDKFNGKSLFATPTSVDSDFQLTKSGYYYLELSLKYPDAENPERIYSFGVFYWTPFTKPIDKFMFNLPSFTTGFETFSANIQPSGKIRGQYTLRPASGDYESFMFVSGDELSSGRVATFRIAAIG